MVTTAITVFSVHILEAMTAIWPPLPHDVTLPAQLTVTLKTTEMFHVP